MERWNKDPSGHLNYLTFKKNGKNVVIRQMKRRAKSKLAKQARKINRKK